MGVWVIVMVFTATAISVGAAQYAFGLFIGPLADTFGWSRTALSASVSFAALGGLTAPLLGRALDVYGARPVLLGSLWVMGVGFVLRPFMSELWHWYALSFAQFVCFAGAASLPAAKLAATWFPNARGRALGIAAMGNNFGGLTVPFAVTAILATASWREAYVALGCGCFVIGAIAWLTVRDAPTDDVTSKPDDNKPVVMEPSGTYFTVSEAVRTSRFYILLLVVTLGFFTYSTALTHMSAHLLSRGFTPLSVSIALSSLAFGGIMGKVVFGAMIDKFGARVSTITNLFGQTLILTIVASLNDADYLKVAMPFFGLFMGGFGIVITLLVQESFGLRFFGSIMGLMNLGTVVAFGLGPLIAGFSYDIAGTYSPAFYLVSALFGVGALALFLPAVKTR